MGKYYFTFGSDRYYPYHNGWVEVEAPDMSDAIKTFDEKYPNPRNNGLINCAGIYSEYSFNKTKMSKGGNFGAFCHEVLHYNEEGVKNEP